MVRFNNVLSAKGPRTTSGRGRRLYAPAAKANLAPSPPLMPAPRRSLLPALVVRCHAIILVTASMLPVCRRASESDVGGQRTWLRSQLRRTAAIRYASSSPAAAATCRSLWRCALQARRVARAHFLRLTLHRPEETFAAFAHAAMGTVTLTAAVMRTIAVTL